MGKVETYYCDVCGQEFEEQNIRFVPIAIKSKKVSLDYETPYICYKCSTFILTNTIIPNSYDDYMELIKKLGFIKDYIEEIESRSLETL